MRFRTVLIAASLAAAAAAVDAPAAGARPAASGGVEALVVVDGFSNVWQVAVDGSRRELVATPVDGRGGIRQRGVSVSPSGQQLAYVDEADSGQPDLVVAGVRGGPVSVLLAHTTRGGPVAPPRWTADGSAVVTGVAANTGASLAVVAVDGAVTPVPDSDALMDPARDSPARDVVVARSDYPTQQLFLLRAGGARVPLPGPLSAGATSPAFSPSGGQLAWVHHAGAAGRIRDQLVVAQADGTDSRVLLDGPNAAFASPVWTADGSAVYVAEQPFDGTARSVRRVPLDGTPATTLPLGNGVVEIAGRVGLPAPAVAPAVTRIRAVTSTTRITLTWALPAGTTARLERFDRPYATGPATAVAVAPGGDGAVDGTVAPGRTYSYAVTAVAPDGSASDPVRLPVRAVDAPVVPSPTDLALVSSKPALSPATIYCELCGVWYGSPTYAVLSAVTGGRSAWRPWPRNSVGNRTYLRPQPGTAVAVRVPGRDWFGNHTVDRIQGPFVAPLDERSARLSRGWRRVSSREYGVYLRTYAVATRAGETATLRFTGTRVVVLGRRAPHQGTIDVFIDGRRLRRVGASDPQTYPTAELRSIRGLKRGRHVIIVRTGGPAHRPFALDAFAVYP